MSPIEERVAEAEDMLRRAHHILAGQGRCHSETWLLLVVLVGQADEILREARRDIPRLHVPLIDIVMEELRDATKDFTDLEFLHTTRAGRRDYPALFQPSR